MLVSGVSSSEIGEQISEPKLLALHLTWPSSLCSPLCTYVHFARTGQQQDSTHLFCRPVHTGAGAASSISVAHLPRLPDELEDGNEAGQSHPRQQHHKDAAHVGQAQLARLVHAVVVGLREGRKLKGGGKSRVFIGQFL